MAERAAVRRRRAGAAFVAVALIASSLGLSTAGVGGQESGEPPAGESSPGDGGGSGVWWDGSATLATSAPLVSASGRCESFGGWLGLFAGGSLSSVCPTGVVSDGVSLAGSPRGVGWFESFDADGPYAGVELFAEPGVAAGVFGALGEMDVIFDGGTFSIDFSDCEHRAEAGYSSCRVAAAGVPLPPGALVGVATPGTEAPPRGIAGAGAPAAAPAAERAALVAFYNATGGANWTRKTNWNTAAAVGTWYGVSTNGNGSVTSLYLYRNGLSGSIPGELGDLANLEWLSLGGNGLSGSIPTELGDLTNLEWLYLERNELSGRIPVELGDLTNLRNLSLYLNDLSGRIPVELGDLTNLQRLSLSGNELSGRIPVELGDLTNLQSLSLYLNDLSGPIPVELGDLTNLQSLYLWGNELSGGIPVELGDLTNLRVLYLSGNELSGGIPVELGDLTNLLSLYLTGNELSGGIPVELGDLANLEWLYLERNELSGRIPVELGDLTNLRNLSLERNELSGRIPAELGDLTNLEYLSLSGNGLSGSIPVELGDLTNLRGLGLSSNGLSGSIPVELGDLTNLRGLGLSSNGLSGSIPAELGDLTNLRGLGLSSNGLSGSIPAELGDLTNLEELDLSSNGLSGSIPAELGDLTNLEWLSLDRNELSGSIPAALGNLTKLRILDLYGNSLTGCVPAALAGVRSISFDPELSYCAKPVLVGAVLADGGAVDLVFDSALDGIAVPPADALAVSVAGGRRAVTAVSVSDRTVTLVLASPVAPTETVTVSYTVPATGAKIQSPDGLAADGFSDQAVTVPPDAPVLTGVESTGGGLSVSWEPVTGISAYDVEWRRDGDQSWQSTRTGPAQPHTIGGLTNGVLYWVRVRAVKTAAGAAGQSFSVPGDWSSPVPQIVGDWAPRNLEVTPGDRMLTVTWDDVPVANDYEVEFRLEAGIVGGEDAARQRISASAASENAQPLPPGAGGPAWSPVPSERVVEGWRAAIIDLDNGEAYRVRVRALRRIATPYGVVLLGSTSVPAMGTSMLPFEIHGEPSGPPVVWSGGEVTWTVELRVARSVARSDMVPFAGQRIVGRVTGGPSAGRLVRCLRDVTVAPAGDEGFYPQGPYFDCVTDDAGKVTLQYDAAGVRTQDRVGVDKLFVFADVAAIRAKCRTSTSHPECLEVGSTRIARPINLVALGDSYSAGESGEPRLDRASGFTGYYLSESGEPAVMEYEAYLDRDEPIPIGLAHELEPDQKRILEGPVDADCRRWTEAYSQRLPGLPTVHRLQFSRHHGFWACTGAISLNIDHPPELGDDNSVYSIYTFRVKIDDERASDPRLVVKTNPEEIARPSKTDTVGPSPKYKDSDKDKVIKYGRRQRASLVAKDRGERTEPKSLLGRGEDVDLVVLTIGGNDIAFSDIIERCLLDFCLRLDGIPSDSPVPLDQFREDIKHLLRGSDDEDDGSETGDDNDDDGSDVPAVSEIVGYVFEPMFAELSKRLFEVFKGLRVFSGEASVVVLGYPHLVPNDEDFDRTCERLDSAPGYTDVGAAWKNRDWAPFDLTDLERGFLRDGAVLLNETIEDAAARAGVHFVPVLGAFEGHETCTSEIPWLNGLEFGSGVRQDDRSFHPNRLGHLAYAEALLGYIEDAIGGVDDPRAELNAGGLPVNPAPSGGGVSGSSGGEPDGVAGVAGSAGGSEVSVSGSAVVGDFVVRDVLSHRRLVAVGSLCGGGFFSPGEVVVLSVSGFAPGAAVAVSMRSGVAPWAAVVESSLPAAAADGAGRLEVRWTVPAGGDGSAPWAYAYEASGAGASGGTLVARSAVPVVAYGGVAPCAVGDAASTTVGQAVRVAVLGNDVAPGGGSLVAASVSAGAAEGASVSVDPADGAVTVTPDAGFVGTVVVRYTVADGWGVRVGATVTVTVEAGCTIVGAPGVTMIEGTEGDDVICVPDFADQSAFHIVDAKGGDDVIIGGHGVEWVDAGEGSDVVYGRGGPDRIVGGAGRDVIHSGPGADLVYGDDLVDVVHDDDGYEFLLARPARAAHAAPVVGGDAAYVGVGEVVEIPVLDNDYDVNENLVAASLSITAAPRLGTARAVSWSERGVVVRYAAGPVGGVDSFAYEVCDSLDACSTGEVTVTVGTSHCTIVGTEGDDVLRGTPGDDVICGLGGHDVLSGLGGDDVLVGGPGNDGLYGGDPAGDGADDGENVLFGGPGDDTLVGGGGGDVLWGGAGVDSMWGGAGVDTLIGGVGDDTLNGDEGDDVLWGGAGDDVLWGFFGNDVLHGGPGDDELTGNSGDDVLWGGPGDDVLSGHGGDDVLWGGAGDDTLWGNSQDDVLWGGVGNDRLTGGDGDDELLGGAGDDTLVGDAGGNFLPGVDRLWGGSGNDSLDGGPGGDYLDGGDGADVCRRAERSARCEP